MSVGMFLVFNATFRLDGIASVYAGPNDPQIRVANCSGGGSQRTHCRGERIHKVLFRALHTVKSSQTEGAGFQHYLHDFPPCRPIGGDVELRLESNSRLSLWVSAYGHVYNCVEADPLETRLAPSVLVLLGRL